MMPTETLPELATSTGESPFGYPPRDEVSAIDLWRVLVRRRRMVAAVFALSLVAGVAQALLTKASYTYHTVVEIGRDGGGKLLDSPDTVLAKLDKAYIPQTLRDYAERNQSPKRFKIDVRVPKGSELVMLESRGPADLASVYLLLQGAVADKLIRDHQRTIDQIDRQYKAELARARVKLDELQDQRIFTVQEKALQGEIARGKQRVESLKDQAKLIEAQQKRLDETKHLLAQQIAEAKAFLAVSGESRGKAVTEATDEAKAMTLLMIDSSIAESRSRVAGLEERLYIGLENERERLGKQLADDRREQATEAGTVSELEGRLVKLRVDHEREIDLHQQTIAEIEAKIAALRGTHPLLAPMQSLEPTGTSRRFIVAMAGVLGLIAGLFAAFGAELFRNARDGTRRVVPEF